MSSLDEVSQLYAASNTLLPAPSTRRVDTTTAAPDGLSPCPSGLGVPGIQVEALGPTQSPICEQDKPTAGEPGKAPNTGRDLEVCKTCKLANLQTKEKNIKVTMFDHEFLSRPVDLEAHQ